MMPYCDIENCNEVANHIYPTDEKYINVALCIKHDPTSNRITRRRKTPSDPRFTKKRLSRK